MNNGSVRPCLGNSRNPNVPAMKRSITRLFAVILIAVSTSHACAWNGPGHMTVAAIAYRDLSPTEREKLDLILKSHPRFQSWQSDFPASVPNLNLGRWPQVCGRTKSVIVMMPRRFRIGILLTILSLPPHSHLGFSVRFWVPEVGQVPFNEEGDAFP